MAIKQGLGSFIDGGFVSGGSIELKSFDPSLNFDEVFITSTDQSQVGQAVLAAKNAYKTWRYLNISERIDFLYKLKEAFLRNQDIIAQAISEEMGKVLSEAKTESASLAARIDLVINFGLKRVVDEELYELRAQTRYHQQGVLAVIGPYNFPAHLVNAHVIPSLLLGNTLVIKPSQICPMVGEIYARCFLEAGFPRGVVNMVQGDGLIGQSLCAHPDIDGVLFTGSYQTGRALQQMLLDQPHKILALELGGKNFAIVMDDADIEQAVLEIIQGAFLTTGQRCTATSRVLVHQDIYEKVKTALLSITKKLTPVKAFASGMFGPLATKFALDKFFSLLDIAKSEGAHVLVESRKLDGGSFVTPSIYEVSNSHLVKNYLGEELFGPNICIEPIKNLDQAIERINQSPFGLSNSIFSLDQSSANKLYHEIKCGVLNINRSTNGALGQMPFGGVNKSGNQRPAGIDAVRYASFPVAITSLAYGESSATLELKREAQALVPDQTPLKIIALRHEIESVFELFGIFSDAAALDKIIFSKNSFDGLGINNKDFFADLTRVCENSLKLDQNNISIILSQITAPDKFINNLLIILEKYNQESGLSLKQKKSLAINIPEGLKIPRSRAMLDRLYKNNFVPIEKKASVIDLQKSKGAFLASIDDDPLVLFDAASQIATVGAGFNAHTFQNAYESGNFDLSILANYDLGADLHDQNNQVYQDAKKAQTDFESFLHEKTKNYFKSVAYGAGGSEANEIAFDQCRQNGPGGTKIIAFNGSFHGRTIMSLHATFNKEKSGPFIFAGYEAAFVPFPAMINPQNQPAINNDILAKLEAGIVPIINTSDELLALELASLNSVFLEIKSGNICCVIIEPMQCEGGDRYASNRFFNGLRALTRALKIPLIFDEVQTGFNLGRTFFWHEQFELKTASGQAEYPDCLSMGKRAQLGVCLSRFANTRSYSPHVLQLKRGLLHALAICEKSVLGLEQKVQAELDRLMQYFPKIVINPRACGYAFAFDMPTNHMASELINQRFNYGFMAYIAGEKTLRFRLNMSCSDELINRLFEKLFIALINLRDKNLLTSSKNLPAKISKTCENIKFVELTADNFAVHKNIIEAIEVEAYEEGRRDNMDYLYCWLKAPNSLGLLLKTIVDGQEIIGGYAIGGPLEHTNIDGPLKDCQRGLENTFYSANLTLHKNLRGQGLGEKLKSEQIRRVALMKNSDDKPRYIFMTGRNRVGEAGAMTRINQSFNSYTIKTYNSQYGEADAQALYYRIPLRKTGHKIINMAKSELKNCANNISEPFAQIPAGLNSAVQNNYVRSLIGTKLTLSNWATPNMIRYSELLRKVMPKHLKHAYFTSGRDEVVDKGLRSLRFHRSEADVVVGFSHQWLGQVTAASRSLSHAEGQTQPFAFFDWPKVNHPSLVGAKKSLEELQNLLKKFDHKKILAVVVELIGERSGLAFDDDFLQELGRIRDNTGIPLVFVETAAAFYRNGKSLFYSDSLATKANMVWWYSGGQLGHVFVDDEYFVEKPLTLISTWDGDDVSILRSYHNLLAASSGDWAQNIAYFESSINKLKTPFKKTGLGTWQGFSIGDAKKLAELKQMALKNGLIFGTGFANSLLVCPKPDLSQADFAKVIDVLEQILKNP